MDDTLEEFVRTAQTSATEIGQGFENHDDDWQPTALIASGTDMAVVVLDTPKQMWPLILKQMIHQMKADKIATIYSTWTLVNPSDDEIKKVEEGMSMEFMPHRREQVVITGFDRKDTILTRAMIVRPPGEPPKLAEWETVDADHIAGSQYEPLRQAMSEVAA